MAEETEMLIKQVRKYVYLFDTSHENYKNVVKKAEAWNKIFEELGITVLNMVEHKAKERVNRILEEGCNVLINKKLLKDVPEWFDEKLFLRGQKYFYNNLYAMFVSKLIGLTLVLSIPTLLDALSLIKKSPDPYNSFKRYIYTFRSVLKLYEFDVKDFKSKSQMSMVVIYSLHCTACESYDRSGLGIRVTQKDMALIQFGLVGLTLLKKKELSIIGNEEDDKSIIHFWRTIGYILGISDQYNLCEGTLEEVRSACAFIFEDIYIAALNKPPTEYNHMIDALINGLKPISPLLDIDAFLTYAFELCGISNSEQRITTRYSRWMYSIQMFTHNVLLSKRWLAFIFRPLLNYALMFSLWVNSKFPLDLAIRFSTKIISML